MDDFDEEGDDLLSSLVEDKPGDLRRAGDCVSNHDFEDEDDQLMAAVNLNQVVQEKKCYDSPVDIPEMFPFPFEAYSIQTGFMRELYRCLEQGRVGIFESPTGTGKSLSLICGALRWLKDFQDKQKKDLEKILSEENKENTDTNKGKDNGELDWISDFKAKQEVEEKSKKIKEEVEQRLKREAKLAEIRKSRKISKRKRVQLEDEFDDLIKSASSEIKNAYKQEVESSAGETTDVDVEDENLILEEYNSDDGGDGKSSDDDEDDDDNVHCTKIYFCSRTHSQLSQFVREVIKSPYGEETRVISLGSRQNLCVNEAVRRLKSLSLINDTCRDLQKKKSDKAVKSETKRKKTGGSQGCPYYKQDPIQDFRETALVDVRDIEQLVTLGKQMKACPYYGTRLAIPDAEIVALPYNTLLHQSTREASGIQLKDNIVIIDEAHNLLETINNVYSTEITGAQLVRAYSQLSQYETKYRSRLKAQNLMYIKQILFILGNLTKCIGGKTDQHPDKQTLAFAETRLWTINDFLFHSQLDNVNMFKVLRYCQRSQISRKLHGFVDKYRPEIVIPAEKEKKPETSTSSLSNFLKSLSGKGNNTDKEIPESVEERSEFVMKSPLMHIEGFLQALTNADRDGRIVVNKQKLFSQCTIKFLLLNPAVHFASVVKEARAVIVAGGTMQPISEFKDQLFHAAGVQPERILEYSCGHVIPGEQLLPIAVSAGPTGVQLDFTYTNRNRDSLKLSLAFSLQTDAGAYQINFVQWSAGEIILVVKELTGGPMLKRVDRSFKRVFDVDRLQYGEMELDELGRLLCNICNVVPGGVICFFPSYDYEKFVYSHWETSGMLSKLQNKKKVFREPKRAGQADRVLQEYTTCIQNCSGSVTGSILFCVVGGKMSEGINFSDDLGRCVIMVGMPYPNINSPELKEKMDYLNAKFPKDKEGRLPGQVHYENLCMKAVNQSIGRAIRHQGDYATILLLDKRYSRSGTVSKLPGWISKHLQKMDKFSNVFSSVSKFFSSKKSK